MNHTGDYDEIGQDLEIDQILKATEAAASHFTASNYAARKKAWIARDDFDRFLDLFSKSITQAKLL